ncbi:MAG: sporulation transcriptional regulator SpoIIID [Clostridia bacterium]|nr:sporulation transcriptional regulator SpoIIID [Clostridia bacterium]
MRENIKERVMDIAQYIVLHGATVRKAASVFDVSKSTVHSDMTTRLKRMDVGLYKKVKVVLDKNREERHIRGGEMTRQKYTKMRG